MQDEPGSDGNFSDFDSEAGAQAVDGDDASSCLSWLPGDSSDGGDGPADDAEGPRNDFEDPI